MKVNMHEAKSQLSKLAEKAWEGETVIIAKAGKPYLNLTPYQSDAAARRPGRMRDQIIIADDFDLTPDGLIAMFEGDA
jgi:antitoxin (DNA-binding transcriptional repressor) of toxin-antitoxin stability system